MTWLRQEVPVPNWLLLVVIVAMLIEWIADGRWLALGTFLVLACLLSVRRWYERRSA